MANAGRPAADDALTPSEWEVVHMVRHGMTNRRIALSRGTTLDGVKFHLENIRAKLELPDRTAVRAWDGIPRHHPYERKNMPSTETQVALNHIGQVSLAVKEIARSVTFFRDTLGMKHVHGRRCGVLRLRGTRMMVEHCEAKEGQPVLYLRREHQSTAALKAKGVTFKGEPHRSYPPVGRGVDGILRDPDGKIF